MHTKKAMDYTPRASTSPLPTHSAPTSTGDKLRNLVHVRSDLTIHGSTFLHIDPETHALTWCVHASNSNQRDTLVRPNDFVTITSANGQELFKGDITPVFFVSDPLQVYHDVADRKAPPTGFKIYWAPQGVDPYRWLSFFEGAHTIQLHRHTTALTPAG